jgi:hypothetical protein
MLISKSENMKIALKIFCGLFLVLLVASCSRDDDNVDMPQVKMNIEKSDLAINESMTIHFTGNADKLVVYTGDYMHQYNDTISTGFVVDKNLFTYSYSAPGTYKVVCVATNYADKGKNMQRDTLSYMVQVKDDVTEITKLSCPQVLYDEVYATPMSDTDWLMKMPHKVQYNTTAANITLSQKLKFYIASDSAKITINDNPYSASTKYDLSKTLNIKVTSNFGSVRNYKLFTVNYPEFKTFALGTVKGTVLHNAFDYTSMTMAVTVPSGTDLTKLVPVFTTYSDNEKVYIGNVEQVSGQSVVDFTSPVTFRLVSTCADNAAYSAETAIVVTVTK